MPEMENRDQATMGDQAERREASGADAEKTTEKKPTATRVKSHSEESGEKKEKRTDRERARARRSAGKRSARRQREKKRRRRRIVRRVVLSVVTILALVVFGLHMVLTAVFFGPSPTSSDLLVNSLMETSALKFIPNLYFGKEKVEEILARNSMEAPDEEVDTSLVVIARGEESDAQGIQEEADIELVPVKGGTYHGYMLIVKDPSRVIMGVCDPRFSSSTGKFINEIADSYGAVAAINAGGFEDDGGTGKGGKPSGLVISEGEVLNRKMGGFRNDIVIGFNQEDKLIVGKYTAKEAVEMGIRDGVSFGPVLVHNGEAMPANGASGGLNPRTAIGQRADGAVLLLVIDGRQVNSLGASMLDLVDVMLQFGAVNAANLDGGSSSKMYYQGEFVNDGVALTGSRRIPTAFIVK